MYRLSASAGCRPKSPQLKKRQAFPNTNITIITECVCVHTRVGVYLCIRGCVLGTIRNN